MLIKNLRITNFKSIYGTQEFDFENLKGLVKIEGKIGAGKTVIIEALQYGLLGTVKDQTNSGIIAWNTKDCEVEVNLVSKNKNVHIIRSTSSPLVVEIDGHAALASSKRNMQAILEEEIYDIPAIAITKMCLITFSGFSSLAKMSPSETKSFLDDIFGFKLFTDYNNVIVSQRKDCQNNELKLNSLLEEYTNQITSLKVKKDEQKSQLTETIDIDAYKKEREQLVTVGVGVKAKYNSVDADYNKKISEQESKSEETAALYKDQEDDIRYSYMKYDDEFKEKSAEIRKKIDALNDEYLSEKQTIKDKYVRLRTKVDAEIKEGEADRASHSSKKTEYGTLGKQEKEWYNTFKEGKCPTCGNQITDDVIDSHKAKMYEYAEQWNKEDAAEKECDVKISHLKQNIRELDEQCEEEVSAAHSKMTDKTNEFNSEIDLLRQELNKKYEERDAKIKVVRDECSVKLLEITTSIKTISAEQKLELASIQEEIASIKDKIYAIDAKISNYNNSISLINENYEALIADAQSKLDEVKSNLEDCSREIAEWSEMNELFTKTLRYKLLNTLIPHINKSIKYYITKLGQPYHIEFDQEFKIHIFTDVYDKEITYNNLSTGQKKTVDLAIIFGILQNLISNVDCNTIFMDELMSNMDSETRNVLISVLRESLDDNKCIFVINHVEMDDDMFDHKIKVALTNKKISVGRKGDETKIVQASKYQNIF